MAGESLQVQEGERIVVFDLETTGIERDAARIVEFCFQQVDEGLMPVSAAWTRRVNPQMPIPPDATRVHGITDADVAHEPPFAMHAARIQRLVHGTVLVAYNHDFDAQILHRELAAAGQAGLAKNQRFVDPWRIFRERDPQHTLERAAAFYLGRTMRAGGRHESPEDVAVTLEILRAQRERYGLATLRDLLVDPDVKWLDVERKLYEDDAGVARFGFGKHKGQPVEAHPGYLEWIASGSFSEETKAVARSLLAGLASPRRQA